MRIYILFFIAIFTRFAFAADVATLQDGRLVFGSGNLTTNTIKPSETYQKLPLTHLARHFTFWRAQIKVRDNVKDPYIKVDNAILPHLEICEIEGRLFVKRKDETRMLKIEASDKPLFKIVTAARNPFIENSFIPWPIRKCHILLQNNKKLSDYDKKLLNDVNFQKEFCGAITVNRSSLFGDATPPVGTDLEVWQKINKFGHQTARLPGGYSDLGVEEIKKYYLREYLNLLGPTGTTSQTAKPEAKTNHNDDLLSSESHIFGLTCHLDGTEFTELEKESQKTAHVMPEPSAPPFSGVWSANPEPSAPCFSEAFPEPSAPAFSEVGTEKLYPSLDPSPKGLTAASDPMHPELYPNLIESSDSTEPVIELAERSYQRWNNGANLYNSNHKLRFSFLSHYPTTCYVSGDCAIDVKTKKRFKLVVSPYSSVEASVKTPSFIAKSLEHAKLDVKSKSPIVDLRARDYGTISSTQSNPKKDVSPSFLFTAAYNRGSLEIQNKKKKTNLVTATAYDGSFIALHDLNTEEAILTTTTKQPLNPIPASIFYTGNIRTKITTPANGAIGTRE